MKKLFTLLFIFFLCVTWSYAQDCTIGATVGSTCTLTMDGVLTIPAGTDLMIEVKAWGAGGGTSGGTAANASRNGGGGGAYFDATYSVTAGATFPIVVGQGSVGAAGGDTSFDIDGGGDEVVGGGGRGHTIIIGAGGTGPAGSVAGGIGGARTGTGNDSGGGGGGGSGPGRGDGGNASGTDGGDGGTAGSPGAAGGDGGDSGAGGNDGGFPGGGGGGKGSNGTNSSAGGHGQVIVCVVGVLPVDLVSFNANAKDDRILLEWQTASEENNRGFEIQKSKDGIAWDMLEFVEGKGTASVLNTYASIDKSPTQGPNYYRLKQLDFDGKFEYSKTVSVDFNRLNELEIFPNPAKNQLTLINGKGKATIYNALGQAVKHLTIDVNQVSIQLADLLNGQYYLQVLQADGTIITKQFAKVN